MEERPEWWKRPVGKRAEEAWLPSVQDNSSSARSRALKAKSWFELNNVIEKSSKPSQSSQASLETSSTDETPNSLIKIRLYPTKAQRILLNKMFGTHRAIYNKLVESSREDCYKLKTSELVKKYRPISQKHSLANYLPDYHLDVPEEVMDSTFRDFTKALKSSMALFKALRAKDKKTSFPELKFKSKKANSSSVEIRTRFVKTLDEGLVRFYPRYFGFSKTEGFMIKEEIPELQFSVRLQRTRDERFYLCIPRVKTFEQTSSSRVCAIDPGVRSFITLYDPDGMTLGVDDVKEYIFRRCLTIDRLISKRTKETSKRKRYRMNKRLTKSFNRVKAMIADMHHKLSSWLSKNYKEVLLPSFQTSDMTSKQKRISSKTSRTMLTWSHYKFKKMLEYKMERSGGKMIECEEHYTTKTCSCCGRINRNITSQKIFTCSECGLTMDRDVNAARNIYLKNEHLLTCALRVQVTGDAYSEVVGCV
jgi:putative transposase